MKKEQYLELIEFILCEGGLSDDKYKLDNWDFLYSLAHLARGTCENPHDSRVKEAKQEYESLVEAGIF